MIYNRERMTSKMSAKTNIISAIDVIIDDLACDNEWFPDILSFQGDTLIHSIVARGDSHGEILAELLALKTLQGNPVFDLSKCNYDG